MGRRGDVMVNSGRLAEMVEGATADGVAREDVVGAVDTTFDTQEGPIEALLVGAAVAGNLKPKARVFWAEDESGIVLMMIDKTEAKACARLGKVLRALVRDLNG